MNYVDVKYIGLLSNRLERFQVKDTQPYRVNFRCPVCGDSEKSKRKARGWFLEHSDGEALFYCHNCGASSSFKNFLRRFDPVLFDQYNVEKFLDDNSRMPTEVQAKKEKAPPPRPKPRSLGINKISQLKAGHPAKKYVESRRIPANAHYRLYYAPKFVKFINSILPGKLDMKDHPRLVLPFIDKDKRVFGVQGRSFSKKDDLRYITIMFDDSRPKLFGLDEVDFETQYYVVEGPIDSLFLKNSVAMAGADGNSHGLENPENAIFVFDNEPRNKEIVAKMERVVQSGLNICIWPKNLTIKDINDMILAGYNSTEIRLMIDHNSCKGLEAKLKLAEWKGV